MLAKRIIPCLDIDKGRVVKGVNYIQLKDAGDPIKLAKFYYQQGADELVLLDITASNENRQTIIDVIKKVAQEIYIPFTVGGGIRCIEDIRLILRAGADKISINTSAVINPQLITDGAKIFGSQCIVVAIDAKKNKNTWEVYINAGKKPTGLDVYEWAIQVAKRGAGEILLTCMDKDGTKEGYENELVRKISQSASVPVIASGGAGKKEDFLDVFTNGEADGALASSLFHFGELKISDLKKYLADNGILIRMK